MKSLPVLLLQLVVAAGAVVVYDQLQEAPSAPLADLSEETSTDTAALERRLRALEVERTPTLQASRPEGDILGRLAALERDLASRPTPASDESEEEHASVDQTERPAPFAARDPKMEPTKEEVRHFRTLRDAARQEDALVKARQRVDKRLKAAGVTLTSRQYERVHVAYAAFQPRINEIWAEVKEEASATAAAGGTVDRREIVANTHAVIQTEFAGTLGNSISAADAEAIAVALVSNGRGK